MCSGRAPASASTSTMLRSACSAWAAKSSLSNTCSVPADLAGDEHLPALGGDAVGEALGRGPMLGVEICMHCSQSWRCGMDIRINGMHSVHRNRRDTRLP